MTSKNHYCRQKYRSDSCLPKLEPNASRWKRCVREFRKLFIASEKHKQVHFYLRSHAALVAERRRHVLSRQYYIIHPLSIFQKYWEIFMGVILLLYLFNSVFFLTYSTELNREKFHVRELFWFVNSINFIYNIYSILNMFTGYICNETKEIVLDHRRIIMHYLKTYFVIDLLSFTSFLNLTLYIINVRKMLRHYIIVVKFLVLIRVKTCVDYLRWVSDAMQLGEIAYTVIRTAIICLYILHYNSCLICLVTSIASDFKRSDYKTWIRQIEMNYPKQNLTMTVSTMYFHSLVETVYIYNANTLGATFAKTTEDILLNVFTVTCSILIRLWVIMTIFTTMRVFYSSSIAYSIKMKEVRKLVQHRQLSLWTVHQLETFYAHTFHNHYYNKRSLLKKLSRPLKYEIFIECSKNLIENCGIFRHLPRLMTVSLAHNMRLETFFAGDNIYSSGDTALSMYLLAHGSVAVYDSQGHEQMHLRDGDYFGEAALLWDENQYKRDKTVVVLELSEIYVLDRIVFRDIVCTNADVAADMQQLLLKRNKPQIL